MRAIPVLFAVGAFLVALVAAIVVGDPGGYAAPVVVGVLAVGLLLVDRKVRDRDARPAADHATDDLVGRGGTGRG